MVDILKPLVTFLRIVSFLGLIVTIGMMSALVYKKMEQHYPVQVKKYKWVFILSDGLLVFLAIFMYKRFIASY